MPVNSVYSYFSSNVDIEVPTNSVVQVEEKKTKASDVHNEIGFRRDKALEQYLTALNPDSMMYENSIANSISEDYGNCPQCDSEMFFNETFLDCPTCGFRDCILIDSEKPSYKDPPREMSYYAYKKINHLNEWLAQFQAKETTEISPAVLDLIRAELKKERITDMSKLKASKLKEVIKKLKLNRCYDHVAHVLNRLNGISAPVLSREVEEKLRFMFKEIQFSFVKHCPKKRSNFLSYSFVLYKFCELLELDEYLPCFPLLKSREKLYMQDKIWQKICEDMRWEFIRTV
jgi:Zn finger protein HypA/HybF involved in hydrogenase expression